MASVNRVIILGNLGADPEVRNSQSGSTVASLSVATSRRHRNADGEVQTDTEWHRVVLFGRAAEIARDYLKKGNSAYIEGRLRTRKYTDNQGIERWITEIVGDSLQLLGSRRDENGAQGQGQAPAPRAQQQSDFESAPRPRPAPAQSARPAQTASDPYAPPPYPDEDVPF